MVPTELLRLTFPDLGALEREIATNIRYGRVFVSEVIEAPVLTEGVIVIVHPLNGLELSLGAQVVMVNYDGPMRGTGIALRSFGPADVERVQGFVRGADPTESAPAPAAEPRPRQMTPAPMMAAVPERPRQQTPVPMPATLTERPRQPTPIPMPATLSDRPRRSTPDPRSEAVTVRPSMTPGQGRTAPPSAPENDWSDLQSSGLVHEAVTARAPAGSASGHVHMHENVHEDENVHENENVHEHVHAHAHAHEHVHEDENVHENENVHEHVHAHAHEHVHEDENVHENENVHEHVHAHAHEHVHEDENVHEQVEAQESEQARVDVAHEDAQWSDADDPSATQAAAAEEDWSDVAAALKEPVATASDSDNALDDEADPNSDSDSDSDSDAGSTEDAAEGDDEDAGEFEEELARPAPTELQQENRQHRLRTLNVVEQLKVARRGELSDRIVVERLYGKQVWEALLQNPRITLPEIARIARKGTVPRPLIEQILENQMWTKAPNVQRALLSNPKLTPDGILKLLKMLPKHELKVMEKATAFPLAVREAARKMLRDAK